jgi:DNA-binding MarR family transcriptional regulator
MAHKAEVGAPLANPEAAHLEAVDHVREGGPATVSDLAERLSLRHHSAVELVDRAEERGFVRRRRAEEDRREVYIDLTDEGERVLRELSLHSRAELRSLGPALVNAFKGMLQESRQSEDKKPLLS